MNEIAYKASLDFLAERKEKQLYKGNFNTKKPENNNNNFS